MRRFPALRIVTMLAILLVATSVSARAIGPSECECCGPLVGAPAAPVAPCCIGAGERRVALFTHSTTVFFTTLEAVEGPRAVVGPRVEAVEHDGYPPGILGSLYLRNTTLRI